jgi:hypothetical protein
MRSFVTCTIHIKGGEMGGDVARMENLKEIDHLDDLGVDEVILEWILWK